MMDEKRLEIDLASVQRATEVSTKLQQAQNIYGGTMIYQGERLIVYIHDNPARLLDKLIGMEIIDPCKEVVTVVDGDDVDNEDS